MSNIFSNLIPLLFYIFIGIVLTFIYNVYMLKKANKRNEQLKSKHNIRTFYRLVDDD